MCHCENDSFLAMTQSIYTLLLIPESKVESTVAYDS